MQTVEKIATTDVKRYNKNRIFRLIHYAGKISRQEIADVLELSLPTVNQNLKLLKEEKLIRFIGNFESTGGRKAQAITINSDAKYAVSVNIFDNGIRIAVVNLIGEVIDVEDRDIRLVDDEESGKQIAEAVMQFIGNNGLAEEKIIGVGITVPGVFDSEHKVIVAAPILGISKYSIDRIIKYLPYKCRVYNDARSNAFAEYWWNGRKAGESVALEDFNDSPAAGIIDGKLYLMLNNGVGGCYLDNERIRTGKHNSFGEFGHMTIHPGGKPCFCGKNGCFESYVSSRCLSTEIGTTLDHFFQELEDGNIVYENLFASYLDDLTTGINNLYIMSDSNIIVGGPVSRFLGPYLGDIREMLKQKYAFDTDGTYLSLAECEPLESDTGAALAFLVSFIKNV